VASVTLLAPLPIPPGPVILIKSPARHQVWHQPRCPAPPRRQGLSDLQQFVQVVNAFNAPLSWLRVLKYMEALSPKTRQASTWIVFLLLFFTLQISFFLVSIII
jgi:hypothetical protein